MKVADYTSNARPPLNLRVSYSSAGDLLCALWIVSDRRDQEAIADLEIGDAWFDQFEAELSPETMAMIDRIGSGDLFVSLIPILPETGDGGTVASFIDVLRAMEPADLRYRIMNLFDVLADIPKDVIADAAEGSREAVDAVLAAPKLGEADMKRWRETLRFVLTLEPIETQDLIIGILTGAQEDAFAEREREFRPMLEADFRSKRAMARRISPERLIEVAASGINFTEESLPRLPIVLMPTMVTRPWIVFASGPDYFVLGYPVADEFLGVDPDAPPPWLVKLHKALGDERRLRILRILAEGDASLADLSEKIDVAKSTLHHHLMLLRAAGLIRVHVGEDKRYSLRDEAFHDGNTLLDHYIHGTPETEEGP